MAAYAATANDDDERGAESIEAGGCEEDSIAGKLLEDELVIKITGLGAASEGFGAEVFFIGGGDRAERGELFSERKLSVISASVMMKGGRETEAWLTFWRGWLSFRSGIESLSRETRFSCDRR